MFQATQHNEHEPGTWKGLRTPAGRSASFTCPRCGLACSLDGHTIEASGFVRPSVLCPVEGCTFHDWIRLVGWSPGG